jgi:hypothetical protein
VSRPPVSIKPPGWYAVDPTSLPTALVAAVTAMPPPTSASPFSPNRHCGDPPDAAALAEEVIVSMIERALDADPGDTAALIVLDLSLRLGLSARAIADPAPTRETPLSVARLVAIAPNACRPH